MLTVAAKVEKHRINKTARQATSLVDVLGCHDLTCRLSP